MTCRMFVPGISMMGNEGSVEDLRVTLQGQLEQVGGHSQLDLRDDEGQVAAERVTCS